MRKRDKRRMYFGMGIGVLIASSTSPAVSAAVQIAVAAPAPSTAVDTTQYENGRFPDSALADIGGGFKLAPSAARAFIAMRAAAGGAGVKIGVNDAYRSFDQQVQVAKQKGLYSEGGLAAKPGTSDHGRGLSVDLGLNAGATSWMQKNAGGFGFVNNVPGEAWHWTFKPLAGIKDAEAVDPEIVLSYYEELHSRYGTNTAGNRILLATFEAALAESNFRNLDHGDRDSIGVFQQRSGWGSAADRQKPGYALSHFLEKLDSVQKKNTELAPHQLAQETQRSHCIRNAPGDADCHGEWGGNYHDEENRARLIINHIGGPFPGAGNF